VPAEQSEKQRLSAVNGDGWRVTPNPSPDDTSPEDLAWITSRRVPQPLKCFDQKLMLTNGDLTLPRSFIRAMRNTHGPFGTCGDRARSEPGWSYHEIDASHSPNITAPGALMDLVNVIIAEART
jgi:hypothetical protein